MGTQAARAPGERPSPGAARADLSGALACSEASLPADIAAPGDGRSPIWRFSPLAGAGSSIRLLTLAFARGLGKATVGLYETLGQGPEGGL